MFNIDSKRLNYILMWIIGAIVIVLLLKIINSNKKENMLLKDSQHVKLYKNNLKEDKFEIETQSIQENTETDMKSTKTMSTVESEIHYDNDIMNNKLVKDIVIGKKIQQEEKQSHFSRDEIDNYFLQQQDFNDNINYSSQNRCDIVDKLSEERLSNTELVNKKGKTISDVFDGLTKNQIDEFKKCKYEDCILPAKQDSILKSQYYIDNENSSNATYSNFHTRYETDNVNNGGKYYGDIEGHDTNFNNSMIYK